MHRGSCALITGANSGIGKETARQLIQKGVRVVVACRSSAKTDAAVAELQLTRCEDGRPAVVEHLELNLASLRSVRQCARLALDKRLPINLLINNAGVMACPFSLTEDGFEMQLGVNHVGHFLLTKLLLATLAERAPSRVLTLSSHAHFAGRINFASLEQPGAGEADYHPFKAYAQSKLANVLFSKELARRTRGSGLSAFAVHPGLVSTQLGRHMEPTGPKKSLPRRIISRLSKTASHGARTSVHCALQPGLERYSGAYFSSNCRRTVTSPLAWPEAAGRRLWSHTEQMIANAAGDT